MSNIEIGREAVQEWFSGNGTVGTVPKQLHTGQAIFKHVRVRCHSGVITVGDSSLRAGSGFILAAGDLSPPIYVDDVSHLWIVGDASGRSYSWCAA